MASKLRIRRRWTKGLRDDVNIELTTHCNLRCRMCPHPNLGKDEIGHMDIALLRRVVDQVTQLVGAGATFRLVGLGDPLLYPRLKEALEYVEGKCRYIRLSTNGVALDASRAEALLDSPLDWLLISLNAWDAESYQWLMGADRFDAVVENMKRFLEMRRESERYRQSGRPRITVQLMKTDRTADDEKAFREFWESSLEPTDKINVRPLVNWAGEVDTLKLDAESGSSIRYPCLSLWNTVAVTKDGNVYPCCMAFSTRRRSDLELGNCSGESVKDMFSSRRLENVKKAHRQAGWDFASDCAECDAYKNYPNVWFRNLCLPFRDERWL